MKNIKNAKIETLQWGLGQGGKAECPQCPPCCGGLLTGFPFLWKTDVTVPLFGFPFSPGLVRRSGGKKARLQCAQLSIWPPPQAPTCILSVTVYDPRYSELSSSDLGVQRFAWRAGNLSQEIFAGCIETTSFLI